MQDSSVTVPASIFVNDRTFDLRTEKSIEVISSSKEPLVVQSQKKRFCEVLITPRARSRYFAMLNAQEMKDRTMQVRIAQQSLLRFAETGKHTIKPTIKEVTRTWDSGFGEVLVEITADTVV